jgi:hypothetical protein
VYRNSDIEKDFREKGFELSRLSGVFYGAFFVEGYKTSAGWWEVFSSWPNTWVIFCSSSWVSSAIAYLILYMTRVLRDFSKPTRVSSLS